MKRKFKQIHCAATLVPDQLNPKGTVFNILHAVADDGTAWLADGDGWKQLPGLPQPDSEPTETGNDAILCCRDCLWLAKVSGESIDNLRTVCPQCGSRLMVR